jgi:hypothetical protein
MLKRLRLFAICALSGALLFAVPASTLALTGFTLMPVIAVKNAGFTVNGAKNAATVTLVFKNTGGSLSPANEATVTIRVNGKEVKKLTLASQLPDGTNHQTVVVPISPPTQGPVITLDIDPPEVTIPKGTIPCEVLTQSQQVARHCSCPAGCYRGGPSAGRPGCTGRMCP